MDVFRHEAGVLIDDGILVVLRHGPVDVLGE
jgi:hypothetical protein